MSLPYTPPAIVQEAIKKYDEAKKHHDPFVRAYERRERSYRGVLQSNTNASRWNHKLHPPYAFNLIETIVANTIEEGLKFSVRPSPHVNMGQQEAMKMVEQSEGIEHLLRHEHRIDEMDAKQRPFYLSAAIGGVGIGKSYWNYTEGSTRRQGVENVIVHGDDGSILGSVPTLTEIEEHGILRDHSTFEVIDPRDFIMHESAKTLNPFDPGGAQHVFHRGWYSMEQLRMMEAAGFLSNIDNLTETLDFSGEYADRETELWNINRTKDLIEVIEYWCMKQGKVWRSIIGQRQILLREEEANPFWHGQYPFVMTSSMPTPFSWRGVSDIELIEELQEILWEMMNQRLDNVELVNNAIMLIRSDIDDPDAFEHYPGARWPVDSVEQVKALEPDVRVAEVSLQAEALLKGDLQNVTSAAPFSSGTQTATVDQKTATGASIVMSAAQRHLASKKYQAQQGLKREAWMRLKNCQQFISDTRLVHIIGKDGAMGFRDIEPLSIQGEFVVEMEPMSESLMRQERRAEAIQFGQTLAGMAPLAAATGENLSVKQVVKWMAKKWDIEDWEQFFTSQPQPGMVPANAGMGGMPGQSPPGGGANNGPQGPNMGITSSTAVDASKPSATGGLGMSGEMFMQRAQTLSKGGGG